MQAILGAVIACAASFLVGAPTGSRSRSRCPLNATILDAVSYGTAFAVAAGLALLGTLVTRRRPARR